VLCVRKSDADFTRAETTPRHKIDLPQYEGENCIFAHVQKIRMNIADPENDDADRDNPPVPVPAESEEDEGADQQERDESRQDMNNTHLVQKEDRLQNKLLRVSRRIRDAENRKADREDKNALNSIYFDRPSQQPYCSGPGFLEIQRIRTPADHVSRQQNERFDCEIGVVYDFFRQPGQVMAEMNSHHVEDGYSPQKIDHRVP
jgi:hypothetical protein